MGRKSKYDKYIHPALAESYLRDGLTEAQAAKAMGISLNTLKNWKVSHLEFNEGLRCGRIPFKAEMENRMVSMARDGNFNACKFVLERRFCEEWKEKKDQNLHVTGDNDELKRELMTKMLANWSDEE